jgi:hypothetical protein
MFSTVMRAKRMTATVSALLALVTVRAVHAAPLQALGLWEAARCCASRCKAPHPSPRACGCCELAPTAGEPAAMARATSVDPPMSWAGTAPPTPGTFHEAVTRAAPGAAGLERAGPPLFLLARNLRL